MCFTQINGPKLFELKKELSELVQENLAISAYYTKFKKLYDDLMNILNVPKCTCKEKLDIEHYEETMKMSVTYDEPYSQTNSFLSLLQQDERQRNYSHINTPESAVMMTRNVSGNKFSKSDFKKSASGSENKGKSQFKKENLECTHCHGTNHTRDRCFHLIGFPPRNKPKRNKISRFSNISGSKMITQLNSGADDKNNAAKVIETNNNTQNLTTDQYQQLLSLLNKSTSSLTTNEVPQSGNISSLCSSMTTVCLASWNNSMDLIVDPRATDHISCHPNLLRTSESCDIKICLPNGHTTTVPVKGQVQPTSEIILHGVLLIPEFKFNPISVSKLNNTLQCEVLFNSHYCIIQAPMKRVKGIAKKNHGNLCKIVLPTLTYTADSTHHNVNAYSFSQFKSKAILLSQLWHDRMGC
ncbi:uncharacterized protein LOC141664967 [Apium graveolens]|uniref:uncharacterized protein LOC141664967 n=1 Tax=Apium graveolens TaxID=4045 RepID=UPI003D7A40A6